MSAEAVLRGSPARGAAAVLVAAVLFGFRTPLAKLLLPGMGPYLLAGSLYAGAGLVATLLAQLRRARRVVTPREARLRREDAPLVAGVIVAGGIVAPVLMLVGLGRVSALVASLLLNLEVVLTVILALVAFREHLGGRAAVGALLVVLGAILLSYDPGELRGDWLGVVAITGACLGWAVDNNLSQRLSVRDPVEIVRVKALGCVVPLCTGLALGHPLPDAFHLRAALMLGAASYGVSVVLTVHALRALGAARTAAFFAIAPFVGAAAAIPLLGEWLGPREASTAVLMAAGIGLLVTEAHTHFHAHEPLVHDHVHAHDEHHRHDHRDVPVTEPHAHEHVHEPLIHAHPHLSDVHHRHRH